ncbi:fluoride efflux transporter FluC [Glutamicibacter sp.]|uniref:fluoride efflux transporter FluC n=1 Tax=Glutamicibacter TaxID=1742989 RepID=UPI002B49A580|nr:CrcB family protein [Glutamicibacter sp.]HJX77326.1 CrcB family protein [Glutamicibacter sp.]
MIGLLLVAGALGAIFRYLLDRSLPATHDLAQGLFAGWPRGILLANILGSFALGVVLGYARSHQLDLTHENFVHTIPAADRLWLLASGVCGSLTTASTLFVGFRLIYEVNKARAIVYLCSTFVIAGGAGALGWLMTR